MRHIIKQINQSIGVTKHSLFISQEQLKENLATFSVTEAASLSETFEPFHT